MVTISKSLHPLRALAAVAILAMAALAGTGMQYPSSGNNATGGGTVWLTTDAPISPGETITLDLMVFDVSDTTLDSLALLDNFRWNLQPSVVGTHQ